MPHTPEEKSKVLARVKRVKGQMEALERALEAGAECGPVLQQIAAVRGAINGLMSQVLESHMREEFTQLPKTAKARTERVDEMVSLVRSYLK